MNGIGELAAVVIDCADPAPMATFYQTLRGGEIVRNEGDSAWLKINGRTLVFRRLEDYRPPTWPANELPMHVHWDYLVDDLDAAQRQLVDIGGTVASTQVGLVVMLDPAGHPFCIAARGGAL